MANNRKEKSSARLIVGVIFKTLFFALAIMVLIMGLTGDTPQMAIVAFFIAGIPGHSAAKAVFAKGKSSLNESQYDYSYDGRGVKEVNKLAAVGKAILFFIIGGAIGIIATPIFLILDIVELFSRIGKNKKHDS